ncbi:hypothetical protein A2210_02355 [Candidatus Woesebacteria bacterium RIFOXYA1_FULL_40_18]|uniref:HAD-IB family hydrolase n=1 Tax=Candidatus Woesebacteria bacterium RIFOXYA1_FULL_40_18 TaxID=1802532 RepID=A0A1F8CIZ1_9BACT|nr:MAG: hypothetical protein A2210_02355 [Candidatus Woesebacteria bacterium RIFOXYA1_FULL_40_18]
MLGQERGELGSRIEDESLKRPNPVGFFDVDGTLIEGFTITSFAQFLNQKGFFSGESWRSMQESLITYTKTDKGKKAYRRLAIDLVRAYAQGLNGQKVEKIFNQGDAFLEEVLSGVIPEYRIYDFSRELVKVVGRVARTIAVSGSPIEPILPLARYLGFSGVEATKCRISTGYYTGEVDLNLALDTAKRKLISRYLEKGINVQLSFAFGDTHHDIPVLEVVGNPFVLGNNQLLHQIGKKQGWTVIDNGKEVIETVRNRIKLVFANKEGD